MTDKIYVDKIFNNLKKEDYKKIKIDKESLMYVTNFKDADIITTIIISYLEKYKKANESIIVDATGGIGGDTISFANKFMKVISIELDLERFTFLKNNLNLYSSIKNVVEVNGNSALIIPKLYNIDVIHIDPPWGGKSYKDSDYVRLTFDNEEIEKIIVKFLDEKHMFSVPKIISLKLPKNYDLKYLYDTLKNSKDVNIYLHELKKMNIVIIENK